MKTFWALFTLLSALSWSQSVLADGGNSKPGTEPTTTIELQLKATRVGEMLQINPEGRILLTIPVSEIPREFLAKRFAEVDRACVEKDQDIRARRQELRNLASEVGGIDPESFALRTRHAYDQLNILTNQLASLQVKFADVRRELAADKELLKSKARDDHRVSLERDIVKQESYVATLQKDQQALTEEIKQKTEEAFKLGRSTVDAEMLRAEIKDLESALARLTAQREDLKLALFVASARRTETAKAKAETRDDTGAKLDKILERLDRLENEVKAIKANKAK